MASPRLSVVMFTDGPTPLVAASLAHVRAVADEIIVAVDDRVPVEHLGPLQAVADRVVRAEFVYPLEANLQWLHGLATGDWILRLDGDDLVSEALVRHLAEPGWDEGITHAYLQYRWLVGGPDRMLDQPPWWPDPVLRLIRNQPGIARFPHGAHEVPEVAGPARFLDLAIYHLDLLVRDEDARAAKVARYEHQTPGHRTDRGWAVSPTYYLPERVHPAPRTAPVPAVDAANAAQVLAHAASDAPIAPPVDAAALAPVVRAIDRRAPAPTPGDLRLRLLDHDPIPIVEGRSAIVSVGLTNVGPRMLDPLADPPDLVGGRFRDASGEQVGFEVRTPLPGCVPPGAEVVVRIALPSWLPDGAVRLDVGVVQDGIGWHDASATTALRRQRGRRVLVRTGISTFPHLGDDLIAREVLAALAAELPDVVPVLLAHPTDGIAERFGCTVVRSPLALAGNGPRGPRGTDVGRRTRDLVAQARLMARGTPPEDPAVAEALAPFADACALVLAPGGGLASRYSEEALHVCAGEALIARAFGLPVVVEGASIGPIEMRRDNAALGALLNDAARITVRDRASADAARRIGRAIDPIVVADPATVAVDHIGTGGADAARWLASRNVPAERRYAVISLRGGGADLAHIPTVRAAVEALPEHTALIYLPHVVGVDGDDLSILRDDAWAGAHLVPFDPELGPAAAVGLVAGATMTIGTRFHLTVLAAASGRPAVALAGDEYDRVRLRNVKGWPGARVVEVDAADAAAAAVRDLLSQPSPEPVPHWEPRTFADALEALLPTAPTLG